MKRETGSEVIWFSLSLALFFVSWEGICRLFAIPPFILPPPTIVFLSLWELRELLLGVHLWARKSVV